MIERLFRMCVGVAVKRQWAASAALILLTSAVYGVDLEWSQSSGLLFYGTATNWNPSQAPTAADNVTFAMDVLGNPIIINDGARALDFHVRDNDWEFTGAAGGNLTSGGVLTIDDALGTSLLDGTNLLLTGGLLWVNSGDVLVGDAGYGSLMLSGGSNLTGRQFFVGNQLGAVGEVTLTGTGTRVTSSFNSNTGVYTIGNNGGTGTLNVLADADLRTTSTSGNDIWVGSGLHDPDLNDPNNPVTRSTGTLNVDGVGSFAETEDLNVGIYGGNGFLNITNGGQVVTTDGGTNGSPDTGFGVGGSDSSGTGVIDGDGSLLRSRSIFVATDGTGRLEVRAGGQARTLTQGTSIGNMFIGQVAGGDGKVAVHGGGAAASLLDVDHSLYVGDGGLGALHIGQDLDGNANGTGALQVDVDLRIGDDSTNLAANTVVVDGANATANVDSVTYVGLSGTGTLEVTGGAQFTGRFLRVGQNAGSNGTLRIDGSNSVLNTDADSPDTTDDAVIGTSGTALATVSNGGRLITDQLWVGYQGSSNGTLTIDGGTVNAGADNQSTGSDLMIGGRTDGSGGTGTVTIENGGVLASAVQTVIGGNATGVGSLTVTGVGSLFDNFDNAAGSASNDILRIGQNGAGTAQVLDGGRIESEGILIGHSSTNGALAADLTVSGTNAGTPSTVWTGGYLYVGNSRKGTLTVEQGAQVSVANSIATERIFIGDDNSADGSKLTITGAGSRVDYHGTGDVSVGNAGGSTTNRATLEVLDGGVFSAVQRNPDQSIASQARIIVGDLTNGNGHLLVDGVDSLVEASVIYVGDGDTSSSGILDIQNGGTATTTGEFQAGSNGNGVGTVNVAGATATLSVGTTLSLGDDIPSNGAATGNLNVIDGGTVTNGGQAYIGHYSGSFGTATLGSGTADTSTWSVGGELTIAGTETSSQNAGFGALNVNPGGRINIASNLRIRNLGDVHLNGGEIAVGDALLFTDAGSTFNFNNGTLRFTDNAGYTLSEDQLTRILSENPTLTASQSLVVDGLAVLGTPLRLNGGKFSVGAISTANFANVDFDAGTFEVTDSNLNIDAAGLFGSALVLDGDQTVNVVDHTTSIALGASLNVIGGGFNSASATNDGIVIVSQTNSVNFDSDDTGDGLVNNGRLILVDATIGGMVSGDGTIQPVGAAGVGGLALAASSSLEFPLSGTEPGHFDELLVNGAAALAGALVIDLAGGFTPIDGDSFELLSASGGLSGSFDSLVLPSLDGGLTWDLDYDAQHAVLSVLSATLTGDFNADGNFDCVDVDSLVQDIASGLNTISFDLTGDGLVDNADLTEWLALAGAENLPSGNAYLLGDANLDGAVDGQDFLEWNVNKFSATPAWCAGDFNADGNVDGIDFLVWNANKFTSSDGVNAVPEPGVAMSSVFAMLLLGAARIRRRA